MGPPTRVLLGLLLLLLLSGAQAQADGGNDGEAVANIDGSGSTIAGPLLAKMMRVIVSWTSPLISMSYRSIGSAAGEEEYITDAFADANDFNIGDYPLNHSVWQTIAATDNAPTQIPIAIAPLSFYHSIPGIGGQGSLKLSCTVLAKIFRGVITTWNDKAISDLNPDLPDVLPAAKIVVVRRALGSGSTYGMTKYFASLCPTDWAPLTVGATVPEWGAAVPDAVTVVGNWRMAQVLSYTPNAIGYLDVGQGTTSGLDEIAIQTGDGAFMYSGQANLTTPYMAQFLNASYPNFAPTADWGDFNLIGLPGTATWPIPLVVTLYSRANLTWLQTEASVLQLFMQAVYSDDGTDFMTQLGYTPLTQDLRTNYTNYILGRPTWGVLTFSFENGVSIQNGTADLVVSPNRQDYILKTVFEMEQGVEQLQANARVGQAYQVHGSGALAPASALTTIMKQLGEQAREPIQATYRAVGGAEAEVEFLDYVTNFAQYNHFKVGDRPLSSAYYQQLQVPGSPGVVQIPFAGSALGIYYNQQVPGFPTLQLTPCGIADLLSGKVSNWQDLFSGNTVNPALLNHQIVVYTYAGTNGTNTIMDNLEAYLQKACPSFTTLAAGCQQCTSQFTQSSTSGLVSISSPALMVQAISSTPHSLGFFPSGFADGTGLFPAALQLTGTSTYMLPSAQGALNALMGVTAQLPSDWSSDWGASSFSALNVPGTANPAWPITQVMYFWVYRNLTAFQYSGPLTKAFIKYTLSTKANEGQSIIQAQGLAGIPAAWQAPAAQAIASLQCEPLLEDWRFEAAGVVGARGTGLFTFSANRQAALPQQVRDLQTQVASLTSELAANLVVNVRAVANGDAALVVRQGFSLAEESATQDLNIFLEYEPNQAVSAQRLMVQGSGPALAQMAVLDTPLTSNQISTLALNDNQQVVQVPVFIRSVSLIINTGNASSAPALTMTPCKVAYILSGSVTSWNDARLTSGWDSNTVNKLPLTAFVVMTSSKENGDYQAMKQYALAGCPSALITSDASVVETSSGQGQDVMHNLINRPAYSTIAIISRFLADTMSLPQATLQEIALQSRQGPFVTSMLSADAANANSASYTSTYTSLLDAALAGNVPGLTAAATGSSLSNNWPTWNQALVWANVAAVTYPVVRADFLVVLVDQSSFVAAGGAVVGLASFLASDAFQNQSSAASFVYPGLNALGPGARQYAQKELAPGSFRLAPNVGVWVATNSSALSASDPSGQTPAIVTNAWTSEATGQSSNVNGVSAAYVQQVVQQLAADLQAQQNELDDVQHRANLAYSIAVAAIVIGCVLGLLALGVACYAVAKLQRVQHVQQYGVGAAPRVVQSAGSGMSTLIDGTAHQPSGPVPELMMTPSINNGVHK